VASTPKFRQIDLNLHKLIGLLYSTDELLQDATALESIIMEAFPNVFGFKLDEAIFRGTGVGQPKGIMATGPKVQVAKETGQVAKTIVAENIEKMYARMWTPSLSKAAWFINQDCWPTIFQLHHVVGTGGVPMFIPSGGLSQAPFGTLLGRPIIPIEQAATVGSVGDITFADFNQYKLIDKGGIASDSSIHVRFEYDESVFRFVMRVDGQPLWATALTPAQGSNTVSPFITLAARA
jgi:HK97 family phage major capsid protein